MNTKLLLNQEIDKLSLLLVSEFIAAKFVPDIGKCVSIYHRPLAIEAEKLFKPSD